MNADDWRDCTFAAHMQFLQTSESPQQNENLPEIVLLKIFSILRNMEKQICKGCASDKNIIYLM